eukprot:6471653-Amphidinium_carterae.3
MDDISINKIGYSNLAGKGPSVLDLVEHGISQLTDGCGFGYYNLFSSFHNPERQPSSQKNKK